MTTLPYKNVTPLIVAGARDHRDPLWMEEHTTNREALGWISEIEALIEGSKDPITLTPQKDSHGVAWTSTRDVFSAFDRAFVRAMRSKLSTIEGQEDEFPLVLSGNQVVALFHVYGKIAARQRKAMVDDDR